MNGLWITFLLCAFACLSGCSTTSLTQRLEKPENHIALQSLPKTEAPKTLVRGSMLRETMTYGVLPQRVVLVTGVRERTFWGPLIKTRMPDESDVILFVPERRAIAFANPNVYLDRPSYAMVFGARRNRRND